MRAISLPFIFVMPLLIAGCGTDSSPQVSGSAHRESFGAALEKQMPALLKKNHVPGVVVACIENGEVAWTKAFGLANIKTREPMQPDMVLCEGSLGKVLTAWGIMRLVEEGKVELDAPANRYIKRWQIQSTKWLTKSNTLEIFDANEVTVRRLLSHTAGLKPWGFSDYAVGERLPTLVEVLEGKNRDDGPVFIQWKPGSMGEYSSGGYVILQMIIEDVSGESFADFIQREVAAPLGMSSLAWTWTPELEKRAPMPYDFWQGGVGYRQLAPQGAGSEICTVSDFARFVCAAVTGPHGEPPGRGVFKPKTITAMIEPQPNANDTGFAYGVKSYDGERFLQHEGARAGWRACFGISVDRRDGFVIAINSSNGDSLEHDIGMLWGKTRKH